MDDVGTVEVGEPAERLLQEPLDVLDRPRLHPRVHHLQGTVLEQESPPFLAVLLCLHAHEQSTVVNPLITHPLLFSSCSKGREGRAGCSRATAPALADITLRRSQSQPEKESRGNVRA